MVENKSKDANPFLKIYSAFIEWITSGLVKLSKTQPSDGTKTILLVDDKPDLVNLMKYPLVDRGYNIETANDGMEALEKLKKISPSLIVLDMNMPRMGGLEFYNKISTGYGKSKFPVLVLTDRANLEETFRDIEVDGFMSKPFEIDDFVNEVERIIGGKINPNVFLIDIIENPHVKKIKETLEAARYDVVNIESFIDLREKSQGKKPNFIFMEYMQKDIKGDKLIDTIKSDLFFKDVPIIVYSYSGFEVNREKSMNAGASRYLGKPEDYDVFVTTIRGFEVKKDDDWTKPTS